MLRALVARLCSVRNRNRQESNLPEEAGERTRKVWTFGVVERLIQDVRDAVRTLRRHHGFSAVVILTLAPGIGANTAIFSLVNALTLRPLAVSSPEALAVMTIAEADRPNRLYGTPILSGRDFRDADRAGAQRVAIVNQAFVREFLNGAAPLGRVVRQMQGPPGRPPTESEIVGVAADAVYETLRAAVPPTMYVVFAQIDDDLAAAGAAPESASLTVRAAAVAPLTLTRSLAAAIARVDPQLDLTFRAMPVVVNNSLSLERSLALLTGFSAALSLLMAAVGLYGVTSYAVGRRRAEIGIRMALGATPGTVMRQVLSRLMLLIAFGVVIGVGLSLWASQFLTALVYGLEPRDPLTLFTAVVLLCPVGVLAGWFPAWRAARVDPMTALRFESDGSLHHPAADGSCPHRLKACAGLSHTEPCPCE